MVKDLESLSQTFSFSKRRGKTFKIDEILDRIPLEFDDKDIQSLETIDFVYRTLCGVLYNFVPTSGHPGGSISSGRIVQCIIYGTLDYDFSNPDELSADKLVYAAGHKALGLYAMWALRNELVRIGAPELLPDEKFQLRLEDLLGFRRNPTQDTPLFKKFRAKALDGHPTPATPYVYIATGASGVGVPAAFGLALGAMDFYSPNPPRINVLEGEGGMTPGRVHEAMAAAATANLYNIILHVDWNQASIDSNKVCAEGGECGEYVQWNPAELAYLHDWNVITVEDGLNFKKILAAQTLAKERLSDQPTAIVYRTKKGWQYGIEGRASHGAGHAFCSEGYINYVVKPFEEKFKEFGVKLPVCVEASDKIAVEQAFYDTLMWFRKILEGKRELADFAVRRIKEAKRRLESLARKPRENAPKLSILYEKSDEISPLKTPEPLVMKPGKVTTLRAALGEALGFLNRMTNGAFFIAAADLLDSTSVSKGAEGFPKGFYNAITNPNARMIAVGGICEDAIGAFMAGLSTFGCHIGVGSSYGAFIAALQHIAARLHGIGQQAKKSVTGEPYKTFIMVNAHVGIKTGEDGPTHADPQCLQLLQENFPKGVLITLTPWEPTEIWPLLIAGLLARPAVLAPFVTRPNEVVPDRAALGLPPAEASIKGVYKLVNGNPNEKPYHGTVVLQGSEVGINFAVDVLPVLKKEGLNMNVYYVSSAELFDLLPDSEKEEIFPQERANEAMGITGFTLPTMYRWITSIEGRKRTLYPFKKGHYLGSGRFDKVMEEGGLSSKFMIEAILDYARFMEKKKAI